MKLVYMIVGGVLFITLSIVMTLINIYNLAIVFGFVILILVGIYLYLEYGNKKQIEDKQPEEKVADVLDALQEIKNTGTTNKATEPKILSKTKRKYTKKKKVIVINLYNSTCTVNNSNDGIEVNVVGENNEKATEQKETENM